MRVRPMQKNIKFEIVSLLYFKIQKYNEVMRQ